MSRNSSFNISIKLLTQELSKGIYKVKKQLNGFKSFVKGVFALGSITAFGRQMVQVGSDFEDAMARVKAVSNATSKEFKMMQKEAQKLGATTRYTASEAAGALENLVRNGMSATNATKSLSGVLQLAQANAIGLSEAADIVTNTMNMFNLSVKDTQRINDVLSSTAANSATNVTLLYEALVNAAPAANVLGFKIEETAAAIGALAQKGVKGADAGTQLRMSLTKMSDPKIIAKMQSMGIAIDENTMKSEGLIGTIKRLRDAQLGFSDLVAIFSQKGAVGMQTLIGAYDDLVEINGKVQESAGTTARMFEQGVGSTKAKIDTLKSTWEAFLISLSQKTSGAVNGAISFLTGLINNFKSGIGTVVNLVSAAAILLSGKIVTAIKAVSAGLTSFGAKAIAVGTAVKTALGGWITIIIDLAAVIGTALFTAWNKNTQAMRDAKKEMNDTDAAIQRNAGKIDVLIQKLNNGKDSLNNVVSEACKLFPDFAQAIKDAADEARKTGNYDILINKLKEINSLQSAMMANSSAQKMYDARLAAGGRMMRKAGKKDQQKAGIYELQQYFDKNKVSKELQEAIYSSILDMRIRSSKDADINNYVQSVTGGEVSLSSFNSNMIDDLYKYVGEGRDILGKINENQNKINAYEDEQAKIAADNAAREKEQAEQNNKNQAVQEELGKAAEKRKKIEDSLNQDIANVTDDLKNGFTDNESALKDLTSAFKNAYEDFRNLTGKTGADNPYFEKYKGLQSGTIGLRSALGKDVLEPIAKITPAESINAKAVVQNPATLARPTQKQQSVQYDYSFVDKFSTGVGAANQLTSAIGGIQSAMETLNDEDATWLDKLSAGIGILQSLSSAMEVAKTVSALFSAQDSLTATTFVTNRGVETLAAVKAGETELAINTAVAASGAAASQASIPYIGPALAVGAVALILGLLASLPSFSTGGIFEGSAHGDMNLARVNGGEMILNNQQQRNLFNMLNNGVTSSSGGQVEFKIEGTTLKGVLNNIDKKRGPIKSSL